MPPKSYSRLWIAAAVVLVSVATGAAIMRGRDPGIPDPDSPADGRPRRRSRAGTSCASVRLSGTVEAVESTTIATPRLAGPNVAVPRHHQAGRAGAPVQKGDLIVEFDRQEQLEKALDRRAELNDLEQQIRKKDAGERAARSRDDSEILHAESALSRAELETVKNELLPKIQAEKNDLALEEAQATLKQLKATYELKRKRRRRTCGSSRSAATARRTRCGRPRPTPSGWPSSRRSAGWRCSG